jgi:hypothetical protein
MSNENDSHSDEEYTLDHCKKEEVFVMGKLPVNVYQQYLQQQIVLNEQKNNKDDSGCISVKGTWTDEEDTILLSIVNKHGPKRWKFIASQIPGRNGKQCRERYLNHLDPSIKKSSWGSQEDDLIYESQSKFRNQWSRISKLLIGRTANAVKNRWNSTLKKRESERSKRKHLATPPTDTLKKFKFEPVEEDSIAQEDSIITLEAFTSFTINDENDFEADNSREPSRSTTPFDDLQPITFLPQRLSKQDSDPFYKFHSKLHKDQGSNGLTINP